MITIMIVTIMLSIAAGALSYIYSADISAGLYEAK